MPDREKVIEGLEETEIMLIQAVDRGGEMAVMGAFKCLNRVTDALVLLKEQEPRVLTLEEVLVGDECWFEYINGSRGYADVYVQDNRTAIIYRTTTRPVEVLLTDYMKKWRCWSYRPTDEQRKAVKWDD